MMIYGLAHSLHLYNWFLLIFSYAFQESQLYVSRIGVCLISYQLLVSIHQSHYCRLVLHLAFLSVGSSVRGF